MSSFNQSTGQQSDLRVRRKSYTYNYVYLDILVQSQYASNDLKQRSPTSTAEKGFVFGSGKLPLTSTGREGLCLWLR